MTYKTLRRLSSITILVVQTLLLYLITDTEVVAATDFIPTYTNSYEYKDEVLMDRTKIVNGLENFPLTVRLNADNFIFSHFASETGDDVYFTDESGNVLKAEIEYFNTATKNAVFRVSIPLTSNDTKLYIHYGSNSQRRSFTNTFQDYTGKNIQYTGLSKLISNPSNGMDKWFDVENGNITVSNSSGVFAFGKDDFTIEWKEYALSAVPGTRFSSNYSSTNWGGLLVGHSNNLFASTTTGNTTAAGWNLANNVPAFDATPNTWVDWSLVRTDDSWTTYKNGVAFASGVFAIRDATIGLDINLPISIGQNRTGDPNTFDGYFNGFRITQGVARYNGTYTPPTSFVNDSPYVTFATNFDTVYDENYALISHLGTEVRDQSGNTPTAPTVTTGITTSESSTGESSAFTTGTKISYLRNGIERDMYNSDFTFSAYYHDTDTSGATIQTLFSSGGGWDNKGLLFGTSSGSLRNQYGNGSSEYIFGSNSVSNNNWHYVSGYYSNKTLYNYVDGKITTKATNYGYYARTDTHTQYDTTINIGATTNSTSRYWLTGSIDELRFSNIRRTTDWLNAEYYDLSDQVTTIEHQFKMTIDHTIVDETLTNFPATVILTNTNFDLNLLKNTDMHDVYFTDASGNVLLSEIDTVDLNSRVVFHVNIPTVSADSDTVFYMYSGDGSHFSVHTAVNKALTGQTLNYVNSSLVTTSGMNKALQVDQTFTNSIVTVTESLLNLTGNFTIELSFEANNSDDNDKYPRLLASGHTGSRGTNTYQIEYDRENNNKINVYLNNGGNAVELISASTYTSGTHHIAVVRSGSTVNLYVDGLFEATKTFSLAVDLGVINDTLVIGGQLGTTDDKNFNGLIYGVKISNAALYSGTSATTTNFTVPTVYSVDANTILATNFDTVWNEDYQLVYHMGDNFKDMTGNENNGSGFNGVLSEASTLGYQSNFDGTNDYIDVEDMMIDYSKGFSAVYSASHDAFQTWSRIIDFGNGEATNNILIANDGTTSVLRYQMFDGAQQYLENYGIDILTLGASHSYGISNSISEIGYVYDGTKVGSFTSTHVPESVTRTSNYIGKSNWATSGNEYFNGTIDELRLSNVARSDAWLKLETMSINGNLLSYDVLTTIDAPKLMNEYLVGSTNFLVDNTLTIQNTDTTLVNAVVMIENGQTGDLIQAPGCTTMDTNFQITCTATDTGELENNLKNLTFSANAGVNSDRVIRYWLLENSNQFISDGHVYESFTNTLNWADARIAALNSTFFEEHGYLANITSPLETTDLVSYLNNSGNHWIGGSDQITENDWIWIDGPEAGIQFSSGATCISGIYCNWNTDEPNNTNSNEDYAVIRDDGTWNDLANAGANKYLVEYGMNDLRTTNYSDSITIRVHAGDYYTFEQPFMIHNELIGSGLTNFPVTVTLDNTNFDFTKLADKFTASDLYFVDASNNMLLSELDYYSNAPDLTWVDNQRIDFTNGVFQPNTANHISTTKTPILSRSFTLSNWNYLDIILFWDANNNYLGHYRNPDILSGWYAENIIGQLNSNVVTVPETAAYFALHTWTGSNLTTTKAQAQSVVIKEEAIYHVNLPYVSEFEDTIFYARYGSAEHKNSNVSANKDFTNLSLTYGEGVTLTTLSDMDKVLSVTSGITGYLSVADPLNQLNVGTGDFTLEVSVLANSDLNDASASPRLIANSSGSYTDYSFGLEYDRANTNKFKMYYRFNGFDYVIESNSGIADNQYHQVVIQRYNNTVKMYVDGFEQTETLSNFTSPIDFSYASNVMTIGGNRGGVAAQQYAGNIKYVRLSDIARYDGTFNPLTNVYHDTNTLFATNFDTVWDENYIYVSHMDKGITDATGHGTTATYYASSAEATPVISYSSIGTAIDFNKELSSYAVLSNEPLFDVTNLSIVSSVKEYSDVAFGPIFQKWDDNPDVNQRGYLFAANNSSLELFVSQDGSNSASFNIGLTDSGVSKDVVYGATYTSGVGALYTDNGTGATGTISSTSLYNNTTPAHIGGYIFLEDRVFDGLIDELRVSNITRSSQWMNAETKSINNTLLDYKLDSITQSSSVTNYHPLTGFTLDDTLSIVSDSNYELTATAIILNGQSSDVLSGNGCTYDQNTFTLSCVATSSSALETALQGVTFQTKSHSLLDREIFVYLGDAEYNPATNHFYKYINDAVNYETAIYRANQLTFNGLSGYLATLTSQSENNFVNAINEGNDYWISGNDIEEEGTWVYDNGPELGTIFYTLNGYNVYSNWGTGEPNNSSGTEDNIAVSASNGIWNDLTGTETLRYVVEFGANETSYPFAKTFTVNPLAYTDRVGSLTERVITTDLIDPTFLDVVDMDRDGDLDIVSGSSSTEGLSWFENNNGVYTEHVIVSDAETTSNYVMVQTGDFNGDGYMDVVAGNNSNITMYVNSESFTFTATILINSNQYALFDVADYDNDGDLDLLTNSLSASTLYLFKNNGSGGFTYVSIDTSFQGRTGEFVDIDNDNDLDIVAINQTSGDISLYRNANNTYTEEIILTHSSLQDNSLWIDVADVNEDGYVDISLPVRTINQVDMLINNSGTSFTNYDILVGGTTTFTSEPIEARFMDVDEDGQLDLVLSEYTGNKLAWLEITDINNTTQDITATYHLLHDGGTNAVGYQIMIEDVDLDGDLDILATLKTEDKIIWFGSTAHQLTFQTEDGSQTIAIQQVGEGDTTTLTYTAPEKSEYTWYGWTDGTNAYLANLTDFSMPNTDLTLKLLYMISDREVTLDPQSGSGGSTLVTAQYNQPMPTSGLVAPTRTGYTFSGYFTDVSGSGIQYYNENLASVHAYNDQAIVTLYAYWVVNTYTVTLVQGSGTGGTASVTATYDETLPSATAPTLTGYTFGGYFTGQNGTGTQYYDSTMSSSLLYTQTSNLTLYAHFIADTYGVVYNKAGGTGGTSSTTATYGLAMPTATAPTKTGYTFAGYFDAATSGTKYYNSDMSSAQNADFTATLTLYAQWTPLQSTVTFDKQTGTNGTDSAKANYGESMPAATAPTKTGYTFVGYFAAAGGSGIKYYDASMNSIQTWMSITDTTLYAYFTINQYTLTFDEAGASSVADITAEYGTTISLPTPVKAGHTFGGWTNGGTAYSSTTMPSENLTLVATWEVKQHNLTYNFNDGATSNSVVVYDYNESITPIADPTRTGYTFIGWSPSVPTVMPDENVTVVAQWNINSYTVVFDTAGGNNISAVTLNYGSAVTLPTVTQVGHTLLSWSDGSKTYNANLSDFTVPGSNVTLTATWTINQYTITFATDGGTVISPITQNYGTPVTRPNDPTKTNSTFLNWDKTIPTNMPDSDVTITALWLVNYQISYQLAGGTNNLANPEYYTTATADITLASPTKTGYNFNGWFTQATGGTKVTTIETADAIAVTVYAQWSLRERTITFDANGGTAVSAITQGVGTTIQAPIVPTLSGYTFVGWNPSLPTTMPDANVTLTAQWQINTYTLTIETTPGTTYQSITQIYGSTIQALSNPTRSGYTFADWSTPVPSTMPAGNTTITATWTANDYTMNFAVDGGTAVASIQQGYNTVITAPNSPTKTGYSFSGWSPALPTTMPLGDTSYTATWAPNIYQINYYSNGGTTVSSVQKTFDVTITAPTSPTRTGYSFSGWYSDISLTTPFVFETMPAQDLNLYAKWTANSYTLTFESVSGTIHQAITQTYGSTISAPSIPTRTGYTFAGWNQAVPLTMPSSNQTLIAVWTPISYTITYHLDGGSNNSNNSSTYTIETSTVVLRAATKTGYAFNGWFDAASNGTLVSSIQIGSTGNIDLYAKWTGNTYTITFDGIGGTETSGISQIVDTQIQAPVEPTKTGYTFSGWSPALPATMPVGGLNLSAVWTVNNYTITFNSNGGTPVDSLSVLFGMYPLSNPVPTKSGHNFNGWLYNNNSYSNITTFQMPATNLEMVADWTVNNYTLTFDTDGGSTLNPIEAAYGSVVVSAIPTKSGYTFNGWSPELPATIPAEDVSYTAQWTTNTYTLSFDTTGGTAIDAQLVSYGSFPTTIAATTKTGYDLDAWTDGTDTFNANLSNYSMPNHHDTLLAVWTPASITITFDTDGGSGISSISGTFGENLISPNNPTKDGYRFTGWSPSLPITIPAENTTYTALYTVNSYTITMLTFGGTEISPIQADFGAAITTPSDPVKSGYTFGGWYLTYDPAANSFTDPYTFPSNMTAGDVTLFAKWTPVSGYEIKFMEDETTLHTSISGPSGSKVDARGVTNPTKAGFIFQGWDTTIPRTYQEPLVTITATWAIDTTKYRLVFDYPQDYGSSVRPYEYTAGSVIYEPPTPEGGWRYFMGWFETSSGTKQTTLYWDSEFWSDPAVPTNMPNYNKTVYGKWVDRPGTITTMDGATVIELYSGVVNTAVPTIPDPEKEGYEFKGWSVKIPNSFKSSDIITYAQWIKVQTKVSFDLAGGETVDGGTSIPYILQETGTTITTLRTITKTGYTLTGWSDGSGLFAANLSNFTVPSSDVMLTAQWQPVTYHIYYDLGNIDNQTYKTVTEDYQYDAVVTTLDLANTNYVRTGYAFRGWSVAIPNNMPDNDIFVKALWLPHQYTITYNLDGGTNSSSNPRIYDAETVYSFKDASKYGYTFVGWFTAATGGTEVTNITIGSSGNLTLYARFLAQSYTITYQTTAGNNYTISSGLAGSTVTPPSNPSRTGYTFKEWNTAVPTTMPAENLTLVAQWTQNTYKITYMVDSAVYLEQIMLYGTTVQAAPAPFKEGYEFDGWSPTVPNTMPAENLTITAQWSIATQDYNFYSYGDIVYHTTTDIYGAEVSIPTQPPTRTGYTFDSWLDDYDQTFPLDMPPYGGSATAQWTEIDYNINYNLAGGTNVSQNPATYSITSGTIILHPASKSNYTFTGWYDQVTGGNEVTEIPASSTGDLALYARWSADSHYIIYVLDGGTNDSSNPTSFNQDLANITLNNASKLGYKFDGWFTASTSGIKVTSVDTSGTLDLILYARFSPADYTISFDLNSGSGIANDITLGYGYSITGPTDPNRTGYTFIGWSPSLPNTMPAYDQELKALWSINQYSIRFNTVGGTNIASITQNYLSPVTAPANPTKTGYNFDGWDVAVPTTMPASDTVLTATWSVNSYTVTFDYNEGTYSGATSQEFTASYLTTIDSSTINIPSKAGYTFNGWNQVVPSAIPAYDVVIKATWRPVDYNVVYVLDGGVNASLNPSKYQITSSTFTLIDATKVGYSFDGWFDQAVDGTKILTLPAGSTGNKTYYAHWTANDYTITFKDQDGTNYSSVTKAYGVAVGSVEDPEKPGYIFTGWASAIPTNMPAYNQVIIAQFDILSYQITLDLNNGDPNRIITGEYGSSILAPVIAKEGYVLTGWLKGTTPYLADLSDYTVTNQNETLVAQWEIQEYTITFVTVGGTSIPVINQDYGTSVTAPNNPVKTGYTFKGWDIAVPSTMPAQNLTITADWQINSYTLTFDPANGNQTTQVIKEYLSSATAPTVTRTGYELLGWSDTFTTHPVSLSTFVMPNQNITLTAVWQAETHSITFDTAGGTNVPTISQATATAVTAPSDPTRTGYTFLGWSSPVPETMPGQNITLTATWQINRYTVTLIPNNGDSSYTRTGDFGTAIAIPTPLKDGYTLTGWSTGGLTYNETLSNFKIPAANVTLTAVWQAEQFTMSFNTDGGSQIADITQAVNSSVTTPADPTKENNVFRGWSSPIPTIMPTHNTNYIALWDPVKYSVSYVMNGGTNVVENPVEVTTYSPAFTLKAPSKTGYDFGGWYLENNFTTVTTTISSGTSANVVLYAKFNIKEFTLTFDSNGGTAVSPIVQDYDSLVTAPANPTKSGYRFVGWSSAIPVRMPSENRTFIANWEIEQYTLNFQSIGGNVVSSVTQNYNTSVSAPTAPVRTGYTFGGWYDTYNAGTYTNPITFPYTLTANNTLYAKWTAINYDITFDTDGGTVIGTITQGYGSAVVAPANPTKQGYNFVRWDQAIPATMQGNMTIKAIWEEAIYTITYDTNGGINSNLNPSTFTVTNAGTILKDATRTGYTFLGWYDNAGFTGSGLTTLTNKFENTELFAKWDVKSYTVTFKDGNAVIASSGIAYNSVISVPDASKQGYTFLGWSEAVPETMPAENKTFVARYQVNQYTVSFNTDGGTSAQSVTLDYEATVIGPTTVKTGYLLTGWTYGDETYNTSLAGFKVPAANVTLTALWEIQEYTVTFDLDNGQNNVFVTGNFNDSLTAPQPTKAGHSFIGWSQNVPDVIPGENKSFKAQWQLNKYTVNFNTLGGTTLDSVTQEFGSKLNITEPVKIGYALFGWTLETAQPVSYVVKVGYNTPVNYSTNLTDYSVPDYTTTLQAVWVAEPHTITFNTGTGSPVATISQATGTTVTAPANPTKLGYTFVKWSSPVPTTMPPTDTVLTAEWQINPYVVTFVPNNGLANTTRTYDYYSTVTPPSTVKTGYNLINWSDGTTLYDSVLTNYHVPASNSTLTAIWQANPYTITFESDGGTAVSSITQVTDSSISAPTNPTKTGYIFAGWSPALPSKMPGNNMTVTAIWAVSNFGITYHLDGGVNNLGNPSTYGAQAVTIPLLTPVKAGYDFAGWYDAETNGTKVTSIQTGSTGNKVFYAKWVLRTYQIEYHNTYGASYTTPNIYNELDNPFNLEELYLIGHTFKGWFTDEELTTRISSVDPQNPRDYNLYAKWSVNRYNIYFKDEFGTTIRTYTKYYQSDLTTFEYPELPSKTGYRSVGWDDLLPNQMPASNLRLYPVYEINTYMITYLDLDGSILLKQAVTYDELVGAIVAPTPSQMDGHDFLGWDQDLPYKMPARNITIKPVYETIDYTITYLDLDGSIIAVQKVPYLQSIPSLRTVPIRDGVIFDGWDQSLPSVMPAEHLTVTATYRPEEEIIIQNKKYVYNPDRIYELHFEELGGSQVQDIYQKFNTAITLPTPKREGYVFDGWFDQAMMTEFNAYYMLPEYQTVYAKWLPSTFKLTALVEKVSYVKEITVEVPVGTLVDATLDGYTFQYWENVKDGTKVTENTIFHSPEDVVIFAVFKEELSLLDRLFNKEPKIVKINDEIDDLNKGGLKITTIEGEKVEVDPEAENLFELYGMLPADAFNKSPDVYFNVNTSNIKNNSPELSDSMQDGYYTVVDNNGQIKTIYLKGASMQGERIKYPVDNNYIRLIDQNRKERILPELSVTTKHSYFEDILLDGTYIEAYTIEVPTNSNIQKVQVSYTGATNNMNFFLDVQAMEWPMLTLGVGDSVQIIIHPNDVLAFQVVYFYSDGTFVEEVFNVDYLEAIPALQIEAHSNWLAVILMSSFSIWMIIAYITDKDRLTLVQVEVPKKKRKRRKAKKKVVKVKRVRCVPLKKKAWKGRRFYLRNTDLVIRKAIPKIKRNKRRRFVPMRNFMILLTCKFKVRKRIKRRRVL